MSFKIVTDSSADIKTLSGVDFESVPLKIITDVKEYVDDGSLDVVGMISDLQKYKGKSRSSCPNMQEFINAFGEADEVFCITITSGLSGSFNSASMAAKAYMEEHPERRVHVIDSLSTGAENALLIEKIRDLIVEGNDFDTVKEKITEYHNHTRLIFALESMINLANNGRVSPLAAKFAGLVGIRAIGRASDVGTLEMTGKTRGAVPTALQITADMIKEGCKGGKVRIHHANNLQSAELLRTKILEKLPSAEVVIDHAGGLCSFYAEQGGLLVGFEI
jgi:DegV family protein with EDD domain